MDTDQKVQALDDELLEAGLLVHRRVRSKVTRQETPLSASLRALRESSTGRLETLETSGRPVTYR